MIRIATKDGARFSAPTAAAIVRLLWSRSLTVEDTDEQAFMRNAARRCKLWSGARIRDAKTAEVFLADLATHGFIRFEYE